MTPAEIFGIYREALNNKRHSDSSVEATIAHLADMDGSWQGEGDVYAIVNVSEFPALRLPRPTGVGTHDFALIQMSDMGFYFLHDYYRSAEDAQVELDGYIADNWVCQDCALFFANGELSDLDTDSPAALRGHAARIEYMDANQVGVTTGVLSFSKSLCDVCRALPGARSSVSVG